MRKLLLLINAIVALLAAQDTSATVSGVAPFQSDVRMTLQTAPHTSFSIRSDDFGKFRFTKLPAGKYALTAEVRGCPRVTLMSVQVSSGEQQLPPMQFVACGICGSPAPAYYELHRKDQGVGNLSGSVMRDELHPIARATVELLCNEREVCSQSKTDSHGNFAFLGLSPDTVYAIRFTRSGFYPWESFGYRVQAGLDTTYFPITPEHCQNGNCISKLQPKGPSVVCE
jgi:hypothetical protein